MDRNERTGLREYLKFHCNVSDEDYKKILSYERKFVEDGIEKIIEFYDLEHQLKKFNEEQFELAQAITEYEALDPEGNKAHIIEEIADVLIMLSQFQSFYNIKNEELAEVVKVKVARQLERIRADEECYQAQIDE